MFWGFVRLDLWDTCMGTRHRWMSSFGNPRLVFLHLWKHYYTVILHTSVLENVVSVSSVFIYGSFLAYQLLFLHMCLFWFFHLFSLCMCLCVECVPVCRPQLTVGIFLEYSPLYLIRQGELPGDPSPSPHTGVTGSHQACPPAAFSGGSGNPDFRPHDCTANAFAISCQPRSLLEALFLAPFLGS